MDVTGAWGTSSHTRGATMCVSIIAGTCARIPYRTDARWGPHETRAPPPLRTTDEVESQSREISNMEEGAAKVKKQRATGIDGFCLLLMLSMFDIVWDMLPDMMHITKGVSVFAYSAPFSTLFDALCTFSALLCNSCI